MAPVHPLRISRTYLSLGATCVIAAGAALSLAVLDGPAMAYYVAGVLLTVLGSVVALYPRLPLRPASREPPQADHAPARASSATTEPSEAGNTVAPEEQHTRVPLPEPLARSDERELIGRADEAAALLELMDRRESLVTACLIGDPGIGKTRLAAHVARRAHDEGATVLYGRTDPHAALPYAPLVDALHHYCAYADAVDLERALGTQQLATLARLLPGLAPRGEGPRPEQFEDSRYQLFEAVVGLLAYAGRSRPLVLVLDNMQWADEGMLLLLRHFLDRRAELRLTMILSCRSVDLDANPPLRDMLTDLQRQHQVTTIALGGLTESQTAELVALRTGPDLPPRHARSLFEATSGNPFFIEELARNLEERARGSTGAAADDGVRQAAEREEAGGSA